MNWNATATQAASMIHQELCGVQRGIALLVDAPDLTVIFGNDNYLKDERARLEVELVRQRLDDLGIEELGFGVSRECDGSLSSGGSSWAMLVKTDQVDRLAGILGDAWRIVADYRPAKE